MTSRPFATDTQFANHFDQGDPNRDLTTDVAQYISEWDCRRHRYRSLMRTTSNRTYDRQANVWRDSGMLFFPRVNRDRQSEIDYTVFQLRDRENKSFNKIANLVGYSSESGARMSFNRYRARELSVATGGYSYQLGGGTRVSSSLDIMTRWFGVEIEFVTLPYHLAAGVVESVTGRHCHQMAYHSRRCDTCNQRVGYEEWKVETDSSVTDYNGSVRLGGEAIAPKKRGLAHFEEIGNVQKALAAAGAKIDQRCGMHVHISMQDMSRQELARFVLMWQKQQQFLYGLVAPSRKNHHYCSDISLSSATQIAQQFEATGNSYGDRGSSLNVTSYPKIGTFEIRLHQGSLNSRKMRAWVLLMLGFAQAVKVGIDTDLTPDLSVLGKLVSANVLDQQVGSYLFSRHEHFATR